MSAPFQRQFLSATSIAWLSALAGFNVVLLVYFLFWGDAEPALESGPHPQAVGGSELRLLDELDPVERQALVRTEPARAARTPPRQLSAEPAMVCRRWGPIADPAMMASVRADLDLVGEVLEVSASEVESAPDYLVRLDSDNNLDNARRLLKELEAQSIDAYVIAGGDFANSVSAGVFSSEDRADRQLARLVDLGYAPHKEALVRVQTVHHVTALVPEGFELASYEASDCPAIAQAGQFL
jgi:hypothetical protein